LLGFQALWLLFVLPGHTRGLVSWTKPAPAHDKQAVHSCCSMDDSTDDAPDDTSSGAPKKPTRQQKRNCAVCYYALGITPPPVLDLDVPELGLLRILPPPAPIESAVQEHLLTYYACGPPGDRPSSS